MRFNIDQVPDKRVLAYFIANKTSGRIKKGAKVFILNAGDANYAVAFSKYRHDKAAYLFSKHKRYHLEDRIWGRAYKKKLSKHYRLAVIKQNDPIISKIIFIMVSFEFKLELHNALYTP